MTLDDVIVYRSDRAVVCCGDSLDVLPLFTKRCVDLLVTDPPYGVEWQSGFRNEKFEKIIGDDDASFVRAVLIESFRLLRPFRHLYLFGPITYGLLPVTADAELIWDKGQVGMGNLEIPWGPEHERIAFGLYNPSKANRERGSGKLSARLRQGSVIQCSRKNARAVSRHPTEKPVELMRQFVDSSSVTNEVVLDPFAGSGSTGVAAVLAGRRTVLIEKDEKYAQMSADRVKAAEELYRQMETI